MEKRWVLFFIVTFFLVTIFQLFIFGPQKAEYLKKLAEEEKLKGKKSPLPSPQQTPALQEEKEPRTKIQETEIEKAQKLPSIEEADKISIKTKQYEIVLTTLGARPLSWKLNSYFEPANGENAKPVELIVPAFKNELTFLPLSVDLGGTVTFNYDIFEYKKIQSEKSIIYQFTSPIKNNLQLIKKYVFEEEGFLSQLIIEIINHSDQNIELNWDGAGFGISLGPGIGQLPKSKKWGLYFDGAVSHRDGQNVYDKRISKKPLSVYEGNQVQWTSLQNNYFCGVIIPTVAGKKVIHRLENYHLSQFEKQQDQQQNLMTTTIYQHNTILAPDSHTTYEYSLYVGPKKYDLLKTIGHRVNKLFFPDSWNWFRWLMIALLNCLNFFYKWIGNYGIAIVLVTILTKLITYPLTHKGMKMQAKTMKEMAKIKPLIDELNEKYKKEPQRKQKEYLALLKEHNISPFAPLRGCLPLLLQLPVFFALYKMIYQAIELRGAGFLWIKDLSEPDNLLTLPFIIPLLGNQLNILPLLVGLTQYLTSKQTMKDPTQKQMIIMMPLIFIFMFYGLPSAVVFYWFISNIWQIGQQLIINKRQNEEGPGKPISPPPKSTSSLKSKA